MRRNVASQKVGAQLVSATDGSAFTGSVTVAVTIDAGSQATGSVGSGACTHEGGGYHTYAPSQSETNGDLIAFTFSGAGAVPVTVQIYTLPTTGILAPTTASRTLDVNANGNAGVDWGNVDAASTSVSLSGTTIATATAVTTVNGLANNVITANSIAANAFASAKFASDYFTSTAAAIWNALTSGLSTASSIGKLLVDNINATISSRQATFTSSTGVTLPATVAAPGDEMDLVDAPNETARDAIAVTVESHLLDEGDSQMLINAIVGAIGNTNIDQAVLVAAIRADLERSGGNLNTLLSRLVGTIASGTHNPQSGDAYAVVSSGTHGNAALKTIADATKAKTDQLDFTGTGSALKSESTNMRGTDNAYTGTPPTVEQIDTQLSGTHGAGSWEGGEGGGGGDATEAKQDTILGLLQHATYGLDKLARTGADGDTLETLSDQMDGVSGGGATHITTETTIIEAG